MKKIISTSLLHSLGVVVYVSFVACIMVNGQNIFGEVTGILGPMMILLLFVVSACIVGLLVLARPGIWYFNGRKREGLMLLSYTIIWLFAFMIIFGLILVLR